MENTVFTFESNEEEEIHLYEKMSTTKFTEAIEDIAYFDYNYKQLKEISKDKYKHDPIHGPTKVFLSKKRTKEYRRNLYGHFVTVKYRNRRKPKLKWYLFYTTKTSQPNKVDASMKKKIKGKIFGLVEGFDDEGKSIRLRGDLYPVTLTGHLIPDVKYAYILYINTPIGDIPSHEGEESSKRVFNDKNYSYAESIFFWKIFLKKMIKMKIDHVLFNLIGERESRIKKLFKSEILFYDYFISDFKRVYMKDKVTLTRFMQNHFEGYTLVLNDIKSFEQLLKRDIKDYIGLGNIKMLKTNDDDNVYFHMDKRTSLYLSEIKDIVEERKVDVFKLLKQFGNDVSKFAVDAGKLSNFGYGETIFIVRKRDLKVVGTKIFKIKTIQDVDDNDVVFINSIGTYIDRDERRKGYGKLILKQFNKFVGSKGVCWVVLYPVLSARYYWKNIRGFSWLGRTEFMIKYACDFGEPEFHLSASGAGKIYNDDEYETIYEYFRDEDEHSYEYFKSIIEQSNVNPKDKS